jgi:hypothetical protein
MSFSKKDNVEKLIMTVKNNPIIKDMTYSEFKDTRKKDYIWNNIISPDMYGEKGIYVY